MSDDVYSSSFSFNELGCCEIRDCNNKASASIDIVIPWEHQEQAKLHLCHRCRQTVNV
jgi:hypothetical protein